jgi:adenosylcobinamide-GDP ribazoletransferase
MRGFLVACRYLTLVPLPSTATAGDLGRAAGWFPVVGLLLGVGLAGAVLGAAPLVPPLVSGVLVVALWAWATGGLHLDGLADAADGLGGGFSREERLAIMRDTATGAYGVIAVVLVLALKAAALAELPAALAWRALVLAPVLGRAGPLLLARLSASARGEGAGHAFALTVGSRGLGAAGIVAVAVAVGVLGPWGLLPVGLAATAAVGFAVYLRARLGGLTGDCLGALVEATEALALVAVAALGHLGRL